MNRLFIFLFVLFSAPVLVAQTDSLKTRTLEPAAIQADFKYLRRLLEETHPGLYRYTPKAQMQAKMDSVAGLLAQPMAFYTYYKLLAALIADVRCAHTYTVPKKDIENFWLKEIQTLPFEMHQIGNRAYIIINGTTDTFIKPGFELLAIDGQPMDTLMQHMERHIWADGYNQTAKTNQITGFKFGLFHYLFVARPDTFSLTLRNLENRIVPVKVPALPMSVAYKQLYKNPVNKPILDLYMPRNKKDRKKPWRLEILDESHTALLRIKGFDGGKNNEEAAKKMRAFMNGCVKKLEKQKSKNLIVDLRGNNGGWDSQGVELSTFLMKDTAKYRYYQRQHSVTDSSEFLKFSDLSPEDRKNVKNELQRESDGTFTLKIAEGSDWQRPKPNRFTGNVYFLVNGGSVSTTSEFTAIMHTHKAGVFIGDETGGAYEGGNGGSFVRLELPNSKIHVGTPLGYYQLAVAELKQKGRGTMPDYYVPHNIKDLLKGTDTQLNFALDLIRKQAAFPK